jgi:hypothetical protein
LDARDGRRVPRWRWEGILRSNGHDQLPEMWRDDEARGAEAVLSDVCVECAGGAAGGDFARRAIPAARWIFVRDVSGAGV